MMLGQRPMFLKVDATLH